MKRLLKCLFDYFAPSNDLDVSALGEALNDPGIRTRWLAAMLDEIRQMNIDVDRALLSSVPLALHDLCARRKAYQEVLAALLAARRNAASQDVPPQSAPSRGLPNLDRVTA